MLLISDKKPNLKAYGGGNCYKMGITMDGVDYLVKFPSEMYMQLPHGQKQMEVSECICEYLGSRIFQLLGITTQHVELAMRDGEVVVLCEDFVADNAKLYDFQTLWVTRDPIRCSNKQYAIMSDLDATLSVIRDHHIAREADGLEDHFWKMFIVDAFIGNSSRSAKDWGVIVDSSNCVSIAPVFGNNDSLNRSWGYDQMKAILDNREQFLDEAWRTSFCWFTTWQNRLNPFYVMTGNKYPKCLDALGWFLSQDFDAVFKMIRDCEHLNSLQRQFYSKILKERLECLRRIYVGCSTSKTE